MALFQLVFHPAPQSHLALKAAFMFTPRVAIAHVRTTERDTQRRFSQANSQRAEILLFQVVEEV